MESILDKTDYQNYHIIIVDNGSELDETHEFLAQVSKDASVIVVKYPGEFKIRCPWLFPQVDDYGRRLWSWADARSAHIEHQKEV